MAASLSFMGILSLLATGLGCVGVGSLEQPYLATSEGIICFQPTHVVISAVCMVGIYFACSNMLWARPLFQSVSQAEVVFDPDFLFIAGVVQCILAMMAAFTPGVWPRLVSSILADAVFIWFFWRKPPCSIIEINRTGLVAFTFSACVTVVSMWQSFFGNIQLASFMMLAALVLTAAFLLLQAAFEPFQELQVAESIEDQAEDSTATSASGDVPHGATAAAQAQMAAEKIAVAAAAAATRPNLEGNLKRKGDSVPFNWSLRRFVLTDEKLERFDPKTGASGGSLALSVGSSVREQPKPPNSFTVTSGGKAWLLQATSAAERAEWMAAIEWRANERPQMVVAAAEARAAAEEAAEAADDEEASAVVAEDDSAQTTAVGFPELPQFEGQAEGTLEAGESRPRGKSVVKRASTKATSAAGLNVVVFSLLVGNGGVLIGLSGGWLPFLALQACLGADYLVFVIATRRKWTVLDEMVADAQARFETTRIEQCYNAALTVKSKNLSQKMHKMAGCSVQAILLCTVWAGLLGVALVPTMTHAPYGWVWGLTGKFLRFAYFDFQFAVESWYFSLQFYIALIVSLVFSFMRCPYYVQRLLAKSGVSPAYSVLGSCVDIVVAVFYMGLLSTLAHGVVSYERVGGARIVMAICGVFGMCVLSSSLVLSLPLMQAVHSRKSVVLFDFGFLFSIGQVQTLMVMLVVFFQTNEAEYPGSTIFQCLLPAASFLANMALFLYVWLHKPCTIQGINRLLSASFLFSMWVNISTCIAIVTSHSYVPAAMIIGLFSIFVVVFCIFDLSFDWGHVWWSCVHLLCTRVCCFRCCSSSVSGVWIDRYPETISATQRRKAAFMAYRKRKISEDEWLKSMPEADFQDFMELFSKRLAASYSIFCVVLVVAGVVLGIKLSPTDEFASTICIVCLGILYSVGGVQLFHVLNPAAAGICGGVTRADELDAQSDPRIILGPPVGKWSVLHTVEKKDDKGRDVSRTTITQPPFSTDLCVLFLVAANGMAMYILVYDRCAALGGSAARQYVAFATILLDYIALFAYTCSKWIAKTKKLKSDHTALEFQVKKLQLQEAGTPEEDRASRIERVMKELKDRYRGEGRFYHCVITAVNDDQTYAVLFDEGDKHNSVPESIIKDSASDTAATRRKGAETARSRAKTAGSRAVGDRIEARFTVGDGDDLADQLKQEIELKSSADEKGFVAIVRFKPGVTGVKVAKHVHSGVGMLCGGDDSPEQATDQLSRKKSTAAAEHLRQKFHDRWAAEFLFVEEGGVLAQFQSELDGIKLERKTDPLGCKQHFFPLSNTAQLISFAFFWANITAVSFVPPDIHWGVPGR
jgi:hypothetical protein